MLAHAGHWLTSLLYVVPVLALVGFLSVQTIRDRRTGRDRDVEPDPTEPPTLDEILGNSRR